MRNGYCRIHSTGATTADSRVPKCYGNDCLIFSQKANVIVEQTIESRELYSPPAFEAVELPFADVGRWSANAAAERSHNEIQAFRKHSPAEVSAICASKTVLECWSL